VNGDTWSISIDYRPAVVAVGQEVEIYGTVLKDSSPVPDMDVYLYINDEEKKSTKTDTAGVYSFKITFDQPGTYAVYTAIYPEGKPLSLMEIIKKWLPAIVIGGAGVASAAVIATRKKKEVGK